LKIFSALQIQEWDAFTIENEPIAPYSLMQRASGAFALAFEKLFSKKEKPIHIFCGSGNNGGDGLCVARYLFKKNKKINVYLLDYKKNTSIFEKVLSDLDLPTSQIFTIRENDDWLSILQKIDKKDIIIDAILGTGLNRPLEGFLEKIIYEINKLSALKVAVDIPSGLFADAQTIGEALKANYTFTFQAPKFAFFFPENQDRIGQWKVLDIGLSETFFTAQKTDNYYIAPEIISQIYTPRKKFDHKGTYGASLIVAGSYGKMGAAVLATQACLRSGAGLLTAYIPKIGYDIMQISVPEAMVLSDNNVWNISDIPPTKPYKAIGVGPGIGTSKETVAALERLLENYRQPMIIDADALNILSFRSDLLKNVPKNAILTPHVKEFERLFGESKNEFERHELQKQKAIELKIFIVLKGAHTCIATPEGTCFFNTTGNPGMATGGSGDVLTGILTSLLSQGYPSREAAILGVYLHGLAGDLAAKKNSEEAMAAGDIIDFLGKAFLKINAQMLK
jgi:ADP-dependent NAD(P)H-hydrate dehydratase / NAD(P)H-hydrate epimerase